MTVLRGMTRSLAVLAVLLAAPASAEWKADLDGLDWSWKGEVEGETWGELSTRNRYIARYRSPNRNFQLRINGRVHLDAGVIDDDATSMTDNFEVRRARLGLRAKLFDDWRFGVTAQLAQDTNERVRSLWVGYEGFERFRARFGVQYVPMGLEAATSSNDIVFMERSVAHVHSPDSYTGLSLHTWGAFWQVRAGGYFTAFDDDDLDKHRSEGPLGLVRATLAPFHGEGRILHLGGSAMYRSMTGDDRYRLRSRVESSLSDRILNTRRLSDVDEAVVFGVEAAGVFGPVAIQGEYLRTELSRDGRRDPDFDGGYVQASVFLTGESRRYSVKRGAFARLDPISRWGAVEVGLRWSTVDLTSKGVRGGDAKNWTVGLNWYWNRNVRLMLNYVRVDARRERDLRSDDPEIFQFRFQFVL